MITDRSDKVHETWRQSSERFDYFVLAVTGALCAYISQTLVLRPLAFSPNSSEFLALVLLCASVVAGFRRIEAAVTVYRTNHLYLRALEEHGSLTSKRAGGILMNESTGEVIPPNLVTARIAALGEAAPELRELGEKQSRAAGRWYLIRNYLLAAGFFTLLAAKVWSAYV